MGNIIAAQGRIATRKKNRYSINFRAGAQLLTNCKLNGATSIYNRVDSFSKVDILSKSIYHLGLLIILSKGF